MLKLLQIRNFLLIDLLDIEFVNGLCVITGETGSGKSIIVNSLNFLSGERIANFNSKLGSDVTSVSATFYVDDFSRNILKNFDISIIDDEITITRIINKSGVVKNLINGNRVTLKILNCLCTELMDINMQGKTLGSYVEILDEYGEIDLSILKDIYARLQNNMRNKVKLSEKLSNLKIDTENMRCIKSELGSLDLKVNEEQELLQKRSIIVNKERHILHLVDISTMLSEANEKIYKSQKILTSLNDDCYEANFNALESCYVEISEVISQLQNCLTSFEGFSEDDLIFIDERISKIKDMERKYERSASELIDYVSEIEKRLDYHVDVSDELKRCDELGRQLEEEYLLEAEKISSFRKKAAMVIEGRIKDDLKKLNLHYCDFAIFFSRADECYSEFGFDIVDFRVSFNPDLEPGSLKEIGSGGEKARFLLALKMIFNNGQILICDEIDVGFGGSTAEAVGNVLLDLASTKQVIVITHQPQVASKGSFHLKVTKMHVDGKTSVVFERLSQEERIEEIARMISGAHITAESIMASRKLLCC